MRRVLSIVLGAGMLAAVPRTAAADEGELPPAVMAIIENAERLRSGQYRASGRLKSIHWTEAGPDYRREDVRNDEFDESIAAAFELDSDRNLFRRKRVRIGGPGKNLTFAEQSRWYLHIPGLSVALLGTEQRRTVILYESTPWTELWPEEVTHIVTQPQPVFDPRLLGWAGWDTLSMSFEKLVEICFLRDELRTADEGGGIQRIESRQKIEEGYMTVLTLWCDEQQGWQPVRSSTRTHYTSPTPRAVEKNNRSKPFQETEQSWERHGDVWVVKTLSAAIKRGAAENELQLSFEWQNVNQPIPDERFDWTTWDFPRDYQNLVDQRLGGRHGINITEHRGLPYEVNLALPLEVPKTNPSRYGILIVNVAIVSVVAGWLARRVLAPP